MADAAIPSSPVPPAGSVPVGAGAAAPPKPPVTPRKPKPADDKVFAWPDLVAEEFVAALFFTAFLFAWALWIDSPLEEPANPNRTPNPSKAPWYFVGLQELLVYFDPWIAGVILPGVIIAGLMVIPYIDNDNRGIGWYSIRERPVANGIFLTGLGMWFVLIFIGQVMRGPSWGLYLPWESWHIHKPFPPSTWSFTSEPRLGSVPLYPAWLGFLAGKPADPKSVFVDLPVWPGLLVLAGYFGFMLSFPKRKWPAFAASLGPVKYAIVATLLSLMVFVPFKMFVRLVFAIKYIVSFPSVNLNI